jgi:octaprenyl-diphosphate synthase
MLKDSVRERLRPIFSRVAEELKSHLATDVPFVTKVAEHILFSGGKHLRPALFVLSAQICDASDGREYYFSSVFEYLHAATLLHDDVVDQADIRRGRKAAHVVYGNPGVILVGDFRLAKSMTIGVEACMREFTEVMAATVAKMAEGEVMQLLRSGNISITEQEYEEVIYRKTAVLIESACYLGAVLVAAPDHLAQALKTYGRNIGLAFQIVDDCLDYTGTSEEFGKPVGHDLDEGKITLPLIRTLKAATPNDRTALEELITKPSRSSDEFNRLKDLMFQYRGLEQAGERSRQLVAAAKTALKVFPEDHRRQNLEDLADYIVTRRR